jgi:twitching motility protein PilT
MAESKLIDIIAHAAKLGSSDVHVCAGIRPRIRVDSRLVDTEFDLVTNETMEHWCKEIIPDHRMEVFRREKELDFSFGHPEIGRFRVNAFYQRGTIGLAIRILPNKLWTFADIGMPPLLMQELASAPTGLVLLTGATGSGKTTSLAAMINFILKTRHCHIVTVEDPIEFVFKHDKATIHQREVGEDTLSFAQALKHVLRQDPDVILIGEMRDLETIETALTVAETGHLVFATLHTSDCVQTINRVIDVFPEHKQRQVRTQLSFVMNAVLSQRLIPHASGKGRTLAAEVMLATPAIRSMIREEKIHQIYSIIQTGMKDGMKTFNQSLAELYHDKKISIEEAMNNSNNPEELCRLAGIAGKKK